MGTAKHLESAETGAGVKILPPVFGPNAQTPGKTVPLPTPRSGRLPAWTPGLMQTKALATKPQLPPGPPRYVPAQPRIHSPHPYPGSAVAVSRAGVPGMAGGAQIAQTKNTNVRVQSQQPQPISTRPAVSSSIQRLVVVADSLENAKNDYALVKVLHQLVRKGEIAKKIQALNANTDFSKMKAGEILYIVGHGYSDTGQIRNVDANALIGWLNDGTKGIPVGIGGIHILTCYSGVPYGDEDQTLAGTIAAGLLHKHQNLQVKGAIGYAYGSPQTETSGLNSVLPRAYSEFYNGQDVEAMLTIVKTITMPQTVEQWEKTYIPNWNGANHRVGAGQRIGTAGIPDDTLRTWIRHFIASRKAYEDEMKRVLNREKKGNLAKTLNALINQPDFKGIVDQQFKLHEFLFTPVDEAYETATVA